MKSKISILLGLSSLALTSLASCQNNKDTNVATIRIVDGSIKTSYILNGEVDYSTLKIHTLNAADQIISTLAAKDNKDKITYTDIDTSELTDGKVFTVTYKEGDKTFSTSMNYNVTNIKYEITSWMPNQNYTATTSTKGNNKLSTAADKLETGLMEDGEYYIGNNNAVDLLPVIKAINPNNPLDNIDLDTIPDGVQVKLTQGTNKLALEDYLENVNELKSKGIVKFKNTVTGDFTLTLSSSDQDAVIKYDMHVVDAYNVSTPKDIFAIDNGIGCGDMGQDGTFTEKLKAYKTANGLPNAKGLVFQNDITIGLSDVPAFYMWGDKEGNRKPTNAGVNNSLIDWIGLFNYTFLEEGNVNVYGNSHRLMLNDKGDNAFPYILTDSQTGALQPANKPISSHAAIFYVDFDGSKVNPANCHFNIEDLIVNGNMGVSAESTIKKGGPMFVKTKVSSKLKNVNCSSVYMSFMISGGRWIANDDSKENALGEIENCRFYNCFNAGVYIYNNGDLKVRHSEMIKSGGPLFFLNPMVSKLPAYNPADYQSKINKVPGIKVDIDEDSFFSNYTEGAGGWFDAYEGASAKASQLKALDVIFNKQLGTSFLKNDMTTGTAVPKFDFWMFSLPNGNEEALKLPVNDGGVNVNVNKGNNVIYSALNGASEVWEKALQYKANPTDPTAALAYVDSVTTTDFGNNLFCNEAFSKLSNGQGLAFRALEENGKASYVIPTSANFDSALLVNTKYSMLNALGYTNEQLAAMGVSATPSEAFKKSGSLAGAINDAVAAGGPSEPDKYLGVCNYGLVLGNYHTL